MVQLKKTLDSALSEIRSKRSLQYGLLAMALLFCSELLLQWTDWQDAQEKQWQQLRSELRTLRHQSRDEATLRNQLSELEAQQRIVGERLWRVSSEAVGQARLKDWLGEQLKKAGINKFRLTLSTPTVLDARRAEELAKREINDVHVEAGARLNGALAMEGLIDEYLIYVAPVFLGDGRRLLDLPSFKDLCEGVALEFTDIQKVGPDVRLMLRPVR